MIRCFGFLFLVIIVVVMVNFKSIFIVLKVLVLSLLGNKVKMKFFKVCYKFRYMYMVYGKIKYNKNIFFF